MGTKSNEALNHNNVEKRKKMNWSCVDYSSFVDYIELQRSFYLVWLLLLVQGQR